MKKLKITAIVTIMLLLTSILGVPAAYATDNVTVYTTNTPVNVTANGAGNAAVNVNTTTTGNLTTNVATTTTGNVLTSVTTNVGQVTTEATTGTTTSDYIVDLTNLTYTQEETSYGIETYELDDMNQFLADYTANDLADIYITKFVFDGVSAVKSYDLDDFVESGNNVEVKTVELTVFNVNTTGTIEFTGEIKGGMIAVNTNGVTGEINLILNGANIDTDSKKVPAIYVYNKDITYTGCKVTIKTVDGTENFIEGGKFKKVSMVGSDELSAYTSRYSGTASTNYQTYTNYYGVYTSEQINNILFARVQADNEDLADGDPYYFYKGSGAISSDIDLYFQGEGYLSIISKNKEGVETKGNLTFAGGTGDYYIMAEDDCLNTTTSRSENVAARNSLTIDVNSLTAIVDSGEDSDEGDAIDSNGTLTINGGTIIALAHPGQDAGIDSETGTYINGGTVIATGDMYDEISNQSTQNFMVLSFNGGQTANTLLTLVDESDDVIMAFMGDRTYTNLVYSSPKLKNGTYYLYKDGQIQGTKTDGLYSKVTSYTKGTLQGYSSTGVGGQRSGVGGQRQNGGQRLDGGNQIGMTSGNQVGFAGQNTSVNQIANVGQNTSVSQVGFSGQNITVNQVAISGQNTTINQGNMIQPPMNNAVGMPGQMPNGGQMPEVGNQIGVPGGMTANASATNKAFTISGISNTFSGVADYTGAEDTNTDNSAEASSTSNNTMMIIIIVLIVILVVIIVVAVVVYIIKKNRDK